MSCRKRLPCWLERLSPLPQNRARRVKAGVIAALLWLLAGCSPPRSPVHATRPAFALDYDTPVDPALQARVEARGETLVVVEWPPEG